MTTDYAGRQLEYTHESWQLHLPLHPDVVPYKERIPFVVQNPEYVIEIPDGERHYYQRGIRPGRRAAQYLRVIVRVADETIRTSYFTTSVDFRNGRVVLPESWS